MTQIFHHYKKWEDFKNGMYSKSNVFSDHSLINLATLVLSDESLCYSAMKRVVKEWPFATEHNLTNLGQNRRAWLGQAACCITHAVPEDLTKIAWNNLGIENQMRANNIADIIINEWEQCQKSI